MKKPPSRRFECSLSFAFIGVVAGILAGSQLSAYISPQAIEFLPIICGFIGLLIGGIIGLQLDLRS